MMVMMLFISFLVFVMIGVPIAFCLGLSSVFYLASTGISLAVVPQKMYSGIDNFVLICIPGFILAGNLMNTGGITERIVRFCNALFGRITGGLAMADVGASMIFAGISGTAAADCASIGGIMIPALINDGYDADFASALTASASTLGPIIPPSVPMIVAGTVASLSVSKLFAVGIFPGLILAVVLSAMAFIICKKRNYPRGEKTSLKLVLHTLREAIWAILLVLLILFLILSGVCTPTEASIIAVVYALVVGLFVYRDLHLKNLPKIFVDSMVATASIELLVGIANLFAWILTREQVPQMVAAGILSLTTNKFLVLLLINLLLLFVGTFMDTTVAIIILMPILLPVATSVGVDPIQFTLILVLNLVIGLTTPPVGLCLFISSSIGKVSLAKITKQVMPFLLASIGVLLLITYVPQLYMWIIPLLFPAS
ncbi:TRAP transporter large permease [Caproiciproducens sp. NJN-50]|uniref:TRAP transporter large permease n=1 Tax=Acutalibacteraceae TaxID=3082771 RepID=UPI000FFE2EFE|nr:MULTISPECIES: TRAP transporter large permease [Acutalibacteraceae]QAT50974.1 TRAP transporter large permease [Caproiciproducens sp. NJN-50]